MTGWRCLDAPVPAAVQVPVQVRDVEGLRLVVVVDEARRRVPDCLAARLPGELDELEAVAAHAEQATSLGAAADALRPDPVELPGAMRWVERRVRPVHHVLSIVIGLLPEQLARCVAEVGAVRARLETDAALRALRTLVAEQLPVLPAPLGVHRDAGNGKDTSPCRNVPGRARCRPQFGRPIPPVARSPAGSG